MRKLRCAVAALLPLVAISCSDDFSERGIIVQKDEESLIKKTFQVEFESSTRATLSDDTPVWEVGESLSVYDPVASKPRTFTVTRVNGGKATISGEISEGDFAFSAVYPASCAGTWSSISECAITIPYSQTIPSGREVDPGVLVSQAYTETPSQGIIFRNKVSLLSFLIERDDVSRITLELSGTSDKSYTLTSATGTVPSGKTLYIAVDAGEYASGVKASCTDDYDISYVKTSSKSLSAEENGILSLGVISDGIRKVGYDITGSGTIEGFNGLMEEMGLAEEELAQTIINSSTVQSIIEKYIPNKDEQGTYVCYTYKSVDPFGKPVTLSSYLIFPTKATALGGSVISNHASEIRNSKCPTSKTYVDAACYLYNYLVVIPDNYGLGYTGSKAQAYFKKDITPRNTLDAYDAALQILSDRNVTVGDEVFNIGYSQGGYNALALVRYLSLHPERSVTLTKSFIGGAPSDLETTFNAYFSGGWEGEKVTTHALAAIAGFREYGASDVSYSDLFREPLLSTYQELLFTGEWSETSIVKSIGTKKVAEILATPLTSKSGSAYDAIIGVCRSESLVEGEWSPSEGSKIYIYHSPDDDVIPYANHTAIKNFLSARSSGNTIVYKDISKSLLDWKEQLALGSILSLAGYSLNSITHEIGAGFFYYDIITNQW